MVPTTAKRTMPDLVVPLDAVRPSDVQQVGTKAATLGTLLDAGFPVSPGFRVTTEAFRLVLDALMDPIQGILRTHKVDQTVKAREDAH